MLLRQRAALDQPLAVLSRDPSTADLTARLAREIRLLETTAERLDQAGAALQRYAQELAQLREAARQIEASTRSEGLELQGSRVLEPWGPSSADSATRRQEAMPQLQARADRLASHLGRARAQLARTVTECTGVLERAASGARDPLGR